MQSSVVVAGMDALSYPCENILTRRANQRHYSIIAQFAKRPWPCPTAGSSSAIAGKKSLPQLKLHRLVTAKGRLSRCRAARAFRCASPRRYRREHSSRPRQGNGTGLLFEHDLRANASRLSRGKTGTHPRIKSEGMLFRIMLYRRAIRRYARP